MLRINLLPTRAKRKKQTAYAQLAVGGSILVATLVGCMFVNRASENKFRRKQAEIADLNDKIERLKSVIAEVEQFKEKRRDLESKIQTIKDLNSQRSGPVKLMEEFTYVLPNKVWITGYKETNKQLVLEGFSVDGPSVSDFVDNLRNSKFFFNIQLQYVQQGNSAGQKANQFTINCQVNYLAGGKA